MIALLHNYKVYKGKEIEKADINPNWRIDEVETPWIKK